MKSAIHGSWCLYENLQWGQSPWFELIATIIWKVRYHTKVTIDVLSYLVVVKMENIFEEFVDLHVSFFQVICDHEVCNCFTTIGIIIPTIGCPFAHPLIDSTSSSRQSLHSCFCNLSVLPSLPSPTPHNPRKKLWNTCPIWDKKKGCLVYTGSSFVEDIWRKKKSEKYSLKNWSRT